MRIPISFLLLASLALAQTPTPTPAVVAWLITQDAPVFATAANKPAFEPRLLLWFRAPEGATTAVVTVTGGNLPAEGMYSSWELGYLPAKDGWREAHLSLPSDYPTAIMPVVTVKYKTDIGGATTTAVK